MSWYIQTYDVETDDVFQVEISEETARAAVAAGGIATIMDHPIPGLKIQSRYRSERNATSVLNCVR